MPDSGDWCGIVVVVLLELLLAGLDRDCPGLVGTKSKHNNQRSRERLRNEYAVIVTAGAGQQVRPRDLGKVSHSLLEQEKQCGRSYRRS